MDSPVTAKATDAELANSIRALAMDAVEAAKSGHPGMPMGMAEIAVALWKRHLRHNPANPAWPDRDRFVLSNGHASILEYSMLYLTGYGLELADIEAFRQYESRTPGHPEARHTEGIEVTTGPLGQGFGDSVGALMAVIGANDAVKSGFDDADDLVSGSGLSRVHDLDFDKESCWRGCCLNRRGRAVPNCFPH